MAPSEESNPGHTSGMENAVNEFSCFPFIDEEEENEGGKTRKFWSDNDFLERVLPRVFNPDQKTTSWKKSSVTLKES